MKTLIVIAAHGAPPIAKMFADELARFFIA